MTRWANELAFDPEIRAARARYPGVPVPVIKSVIAAESGFDPTAVRGEPHVDDASIGLMQILIQTARSLGYGGTSQSLFTPGVNIFYGVKLLDQLYRRLNNWNDAISAYNGGVRPELGFGGTATAPVRVCLARDPQTGRCINWRNTPVGEYSNQAYVDKVRGYMKYFAHDRATTEGERGVFQLPSIPALSDLPSQLTATGVGVGTLILVGGIVYLVLQARKR